MKPSPDAIDHAVLQQAAHWYAQLQGAASPQLQAGWERWHAEHDSHRRAWQYVERIGLRFGQLQSERQIAQDTLDAVRQQQRSRRQVLRSLVMLGGGSLLAWAGWSPARRQLQVWRADQHSAVGEVRSLTLADGSRLWLNSASALNIELHSHQRVLRLLQGEVLIDTARDARPFFVETAEGRLQALGTRFSVLQEAGGTRLNVFAGAVAIQTATSGASDVVDAGRQRRFDRNSLGEERAADAGRQSWSRGMLQAEDLPLAEVVAELARHRHSHIGVAPEIANLRVMGTFPLHDGDLALAMLESALPIRIERTLPWWISLEARR